MSLADRLASERRYQTEGERALAVPVADPPGEDLVAEVLRLVTNWWDRERTDGRLSDLVQLAGALDEAELRPVQLEALAELYRAGGLLGSIGVGHGKTLIALLAARVLRSRRPVLLCPPGLVSVVLEEAARFGRAFAIRADLVIVPYSLLSRPERRTLLEDLRPDLLVADEAHHLRHLTSARTKRVLRYLAAHPECRFVAMSGTLTSRSLKDFAHLAEAALEERSPVPRSGAALSSWSAVLDADGDPLPNDWQAVRPLVNRFDPIDYHAKPDLMSRRRARAAFQRRLAQTPGVVLTEGSSCDCSLVIRRVREPEVPPEVLELMTRVDAEGATPDGERVFATDEEGAACKRRLALGFHYTWDWRGVDEADRRTWLDARSSYYAGLRAVLAMDLPGLDSPGLIERAARTQILEALDERLPRWFLERFVRWQETRDLADPDTVEVWHSTFLLDDAARWLGEQDEPAILWYRDRAFGRALARLGVDVRGEGDQPPRTPGPVAMSIAAQGQGFNLQAWRVNRIVGCPSSGKTLEQLLGRTHRAGQRADVVVCDVYQHHPGERRAFARALEDARYSEGTTGQRQKLLLARVVDARGGVDTL